MHTGNYEMEVPEMAKTSMFGGHLASNNDQSQSVDRPRQPSHFMQPANNHSKSY